MKKILEIVLWIAVIASLAYMAYFRFANSALTETQLLIEFLPIVLPAVVCTFVIGYLRS